MANVGGGGGSQYSLEPMLQYLLDTGQSLCPIRVHLEKKGLGFHGVAVTQHDEMATNCVRGMRVTLTHIQTETKEDLASDTNVRHHSYIT